MHEFYRDYLEGQFVPDVKVVKRADNGHYTVSSCGIEVTHHDQMEAINRLSEKIQSALLEGTLHPGSGA